MVRLANHRRLLEVVSRLRGAKTSAVATAAKTPRKAPKRIVAVLETDACFADAVQVLTGCTFGKGNFIYKDYGKMAVTLFSRKSGRGVRVSMRHGVFSTDDEHTGLLQKVMQNEADDQERQRFNQLHRARSGDILQMDEARLFKIEKSHSPLPPNAHMAPSQPCDQCHEPTMATKLVQRSGRKVCLACAGL